MSQNKVDVSDYTQTGATVKPYEGLPILQTGVGVGLFIPSRTMSEEQQNALAPLIDDVQFKKALVNGVSFNKGYITILAESTAWQYKHKETGTITYVKNAYNSEMQLEHTKIGGNTTPKVVEIKNVSEYIKEKGVPESLTTVLCLIDVISPSDGEIDKNGNPVEKLLIENMLVRLSVNGVNRSKAWKTLLIETNKVVMAVQGAYDWDIDLNPTYFKIPITTKNVTYTISGGDTDSMSIIAVDKLKLESHGSVKFLLSSKAHTENVIKVIGTTDEPIGIEQHIPTAIPVAINTLNNSIDLKEITPEFFDWNLVTSNPAYQSLTFDNK